MSRSSNDDRSDRFNPNNSAHSAAEANEARQRGANFDDGGEAPVRDLLLRLVRPTQIAFTPDGRSS